MKKKASNVKRTPAAAVQRAVRRQVLAAAKNMDWMQVVFNSGPPCFHLDTDGSFCGRAERWEGHGDLHGFVSLEKLLRVLSPNGGANPTGGVE